MKIRHGLHMTILLLSLAALPAAFADDATVNEALASKKAKTNTDKKSVAQKLPTELPKYKIKKTKKIEINFENPAEAGTHTTTVNGRSTLPLDVAIADQKSAENEMRKTTPRLTQETDFHETKKKIATRLPEKTQGKSVSQNDAAFAQPAVIIRPEGSSQQAAAVTTIKSQAKTPVSPSDVFEVVPPAPTPHVLKPVPLSQLMAESPTPTPVAIPPTPAVVLPTPHSTPAQSKAAATLTMTTTATPVVVATATPVVVATATPVVIATATPVVIATATPVVIATATPAAQQVSAAQKAVIAQPNSNIKNLAPFLPTSPVQTFSENPYFTPAPRATPAVVPSATPTVPPVVKPTPVVARATPTPTIALATPTPTPAPTPFIARETVAPTPTSTPLATATPAALPVATSVVAPKSMIKEDVAPVLSDDFEVSETNRFYVRASYLDAQYSHLESDLENGATTFGFGVARTRGDFEGRILLEIGHGLDQAVVPQNTRIFAFRADVIYEFMRSQSSLVTPIAGIGLGYTYFNVFSVRSDNGSTQTIRINDQTTAMTTSPAVGVRFKLPKALTLDLTAEYLILLSGGDTASLGGFASAVSFGVPF